MDFSYALLLAFLPTLTISLSMTFPSNISILGCGWLGLPLAKHLLEKGFAVKGSTTSEDKLSKLNEAGIRAYQIQVAANGLSGDISAFLNSELLILNIPPGRRDPNVAISFPQKIKHLLQALTHSPVAQLILISSTSVYGDASGIITEESPLLATAGSGKALIAVEELLQQTSLQVSILRPGGLVGPDRHPGRFLAGRSGLDNGDASVNLVHLEDVIGIISAVIEQQCWDTDFNLCADLHPSRAAYYTYAAKQMGLEVPTFEPGGENAKRISNEKVKRELGYTFRYADPFEMLKNV